MKNILIILLILFWISCCPDKPCPECPDPTEEQCDSLFVPDTVYKSDPYPVYITDTIIKHDTVVIYNEYIEKDSFNILFSEDFETLPDMKFSTILTYWHPLVSFYHEESQSIVEVNGNKMWQSIYHKDKEAQADGFEMFIPLNDTISEVWFENKIWADPGFNGYSTKCYYSGKIMNGLYGGRTPLYACNPWCLDSSAYGNGWGLDGEWGSASGGCNSGNPNAIWPYYGDAGGYYKTMQPFGYIPRGEEVIWTRRIKINDKGKANGILEWYVNGKLVQQKTDVIWRSVAAANAKQNNIDGILLRYTTGGTPGPNYISSRDNVICIDDMVLYQIPKDSKYYLSGPAPKEYIIPILGSKGSKYPNPSFYNEVFTRSKDIIQSHYSGVFHIPQSFETFTKVITGHSNPINLSFTYWHDGYNNNDKEDCWVKIYSGTGAEKKLLVMYKEGADGYPAPIIGSIISVPNTECTIEYYPGRDFNAGWKLKYW